jgi:hypothetical protein
MTDSAANGVGLVNEGQVQRRGAQKAEQEMVIDGDNDVSCDCFVYPPKSMQPCHARSTPILLRGSPRSGRCIDEDPTSGGRFGDTFLRTW